VQRLPTLPAQRRVALAVSVGIVPWPPVALDNKANVEEREISAVVPDPVLGDRRQVTLTHGAVEDFLDRRERRHSIGSRSEVKPGDDVTEALERPRVADWIDEPAGIEVVEGRQRTRGGDSREAWPRKPAGIFPCRRGRRGAAGYLTQA
jgi:hypothetical protein